MKIVHEDGVWLVNKCRYPMADPTQDVRLDPGERTCVRLSDWLKMQMAEGLFERVEGLKSAPSAAPTAAPTVPQARAMAMPAKGKTTST